MDNNLWLASNPKEKFLIKSESHSNTSINKINTSKPTKNANLINKRICDNTNQTIKELIKPGLYKNNVLISLKNENIN